MVFTGLYGACHVPYLDTAGVMADRIHITEGGGAQVAKVLKDAAVAAGATIQTSVEAKSLITNATTGAVIGVKAHGAGGDFTVGANKGVVVATSSFDHNNEMAKALSAQQYWDNTSQANFCAPTNTGDGIRMGMQIGAALAGFGGTIDYEFTTGLGGSNASPQIAGVLVNGRAQRFVCEDATYAYIMRAIFQQQAMHKAMVYLVMDSRGVRGKASPWADKAKLAAAVKSGQLVKGTSLLDLARKIKVPAVNLQATMANWNRNITRFHKDKRVPAQHATGAHQQGALLRLQARLRQPRLHRWPEDRRQRTGHRRQRQPDPAPVCRRHGIRRLDRPVLSGQRHGDLRCHPLGPQGRRPRGQRRGVTLSLLCPSHTDRRGKTASGSLLHMAPRR